MKSEMPSSGAGLESTKARCLSPHRMRVTRRDDIESRTCDIETHWVDIEQNTSHDLGKALCIGMMIQRRDRRLEKLALSPLFVMIQAFDLGWGLPDKKQGGGKQ